MNTRVTKDDWLARAAAVQEMGAKAQTSGTQEAALQWAQSPDIAQMHRRIVNPALSGEMNASNWIVLRRTCDSALQVLGKAQVADVEPFRELMAERQELDQLAGMHADWRELSDLLDELSSFDESVVAEAQALAGKPSLSANQTFRKPSEVRALLEKARALQGHSGLCAELRRSWNENPSLKKGWPPAMVKWVQLGAQLEPHEWSCWCTATRVIADWPGGALDSATGRIASSVRGQVLDTIAQQAYPELLQMGWSSWDWEAINANTRRGWERAMTQHDALPSGEQVVHLYNVDVSQRLFNLSLDDKPLPPQLKPLEDPTKRLETAHTTMSTWLGDPDWVDPTEAIANQSMANVIYDTVSGMGTALVMFLEGHAKPKAVAFQVNLTATRGPHEELESVQITATTEVALLRTADDQPLLPIDRATLTTTLERDTTGRFQLTNFTPHLGAT
jgi:hypothetical protein